MSFRGKRPAVLQVNKFYWPVCGGVERVVQQLSEGLADRTKTTVLACGEHKGRGEAGEIKGVRVVRCSSLGTLFSMPISPSFIWKFRQEAKKSPVLLLHMPFPMADLALLLSGYKGRVVLWWHSDIVRQKKLLRVISPLIRHTLKRADGIIVATKGHIEGSDWLGEYEGKCHIVPFGVEPAILQKAAKTPKPKKHSNSFNMLFVGRLVYYKGCNVLIKAFAEALKSAPKAGFRLTLVGEGPLEDELKGLAKTLKVGDFIDFKKGLTDAELGEAFEECDIFVLPSVAKSEAFGLVQIEAMAHGKPVINTRLPSGVPYVSLDGQTGLTVAPSDVKSLAEAMLRLYREPKIREEMGKAAQKRALEVFSMEAMLDGAYKIMFPEG